MSEEAIEDTTLATQGKFLWDIVPCDDAVFFYELLGLVTPSAEGMQVEHTASHARLEPVGKLLAVIGLQAELISRVCTAKMLRADMPSVAPEHLQSILRQNCDVAVSALVAGLAQLLEDGILKYGDQG